MVKVGFKHICCVGNNCPDIHLFASSTSTHPLRFSYSPAKHHCDLLLDIGFCTGLAAVSASGLGGGLIGEGVARRTGAGVARWIGAGAGVAMWIGAGAGVAIGVGLGK